MMGIDSERQEPPWKGIYGINRERVKLWKACHEGGEGGPPADARRRPGRGEVDSAGFHRFSSVKGSGHRVSPSLASAELDRLKEIRSRLERLKGGEDPEKMRKLINRNLSALRDARFKFAAKGEDLGRVIRFGGLASVLADIRTMTRTDRELATMLGHPADAPLDESYTGPREQMRLWDKLVELIDHWEC